MTTKMVKLSALKLHDKNPRKITGPKMEALKKSLQDFPKMMELQPFIIDEASILLRGNMRHSALKQLGYSEIPATWVKKATELTSEEKEKFMLLDNDHYGEWDYDILGTQWPVASFANWNLSMPKFGEVAKLTSTKTRADKGTIVRVKCADSTAAQELFKDLVSKGFDAELK